MQTQTSREYQWLQQLVGEWTYETEAMVEPGKPAEKCTGTESVRSLGDLWVVAEGQGQMPGGGHAQMIMTLGYDPQRKRYTGTWIGSMMPDLWVYDGGLDAAERVLTLEADGSAMTPEGPIPGKTARYRDVIEIESLDHRVLRSHVLGEDGTWQQFMTAHYRRKR